MCRFFTVGVISWVMLWQVVCPAGLIAAEKVTVPPSDLKTSRDPAVFVRQLEKALSQAQRALSAFESASPLGDRQGEDLEYGVQAARNAYVLIRSALAGIAQAKQQTGNRQTTLDQAYKRIDRAWVLVRSPVGGYSSLGIPRQQYLEDSVSKLTEAMQLVRSALVLLR